MKNTSLRRYIEEKTPTSPHALKDCELVIDGASYFKNTYKISGCEFILGPECDRYANFITNKLRPFLDSKIKCYVIFNGATKHDLDRLKEIHENMIGNRCSNNLDNIKYFQPLLVKDVEKQVLEEMEIKYFVCEYDVLEAVVAVARKFKCPVLTNHIEYSLYGVSCIPLSSLEYDNINKEFKCNIYEQDAVKAAFGVYSKMPILLTLLNEKCDVYLKELKEEVLFDQSDAILPVVRWVKRQREAAVVQTVSKINDGYQKNTFMEVYKKIQTLYLYPSCHLAVKYFQREKLHGLFRDDKKWFAKGVSNGRIPPPYINLKKNGIICGSLITNDRNRPDALLAAIDVIVYTHCLLTNSQDSVITFVERKYDSIITREIVTTWEKEISTREIFSQHRIKNKLHSVTDDPFKIFLAETLPGHDHNKPLVTLFKDYWILILALVYYVYKKNNSFIDGAYCILLSYVMLGPVSRTIDAQKNNALLSLNSDNDCTDFYNGLKFLFDTGNAKRNLNISIIHNFSEFQHCLQHFNYLNKLSGEKIPGNIYHQTFNATFIYNTFLLMKNKKNIMTFLENKFMGSKYLRIYKSLVTDFENCLSNVKGCLKNTK